MKKGKRLFSYLGSGFAFSMLFGLAAFLPEAKAEAALQVQEINYEDSTIKVKSDSGDKILYFSDKNKKKWEMSVDPFNSGVCTMDISWVSTTKDYMLTFKGDKSTDILSVTLPKQVTNFKAKYNQATGEATFTNQGSREVEYRKNGTDTWKPYDIAKNKENLKDSLQRLCENGASVYFRLKSENGTSESTAGQRPSKEVACKINKKSAAPTVTIDTVNSTIAVQSGWEWRTAKITEKSGVQYTTTNSEWQKFSSGRDVPLSELAPEAVYKEDRSDLASEVEKKDIYLQFRKSATASTQLSYITTIKVPAQDKAPTVEEANVSYKYTSKTSFKLTFSAASSNNPYEYCIVDSDDLKDEKTISDMESVEWKSVTSAASTEIQKKEAPEDSVIFFRKKAIGKVGDDNFKLASPYTKFEKLEYKFDTSDEINKDCYVFDGVCKTGNSDGKITFTFQSAFESKVESMSLSQTKEIEGISKVTINSSVVANKSKTSENDKYIVTTTMTNIELSPDIKSLLDQERELVLYAYIKLSNGETITSDETNGIRIHIKPQSSIDKDTTSYSGDKEYAYNVSRFVGTKVPTQGSIGTDQYKDFHFKINMGAEYGSSLGEYCKDKTMGIESVQLGNYQLQASDYEYNSTTEMFTVHLEKFETNPAVVSSYNTTQNLIIKLTNGEKLTDVNIKLVPPVVLDKNYVWAFTKGQLVEEVTNTTTSSSGEKVEKVEKINDYSVGYTIGRDSSSEMLIKQCVLKSVKLNGKNILAKTEEEKIIFSNELLNEVDPGAHNVEFVFDITYSNGMVQTYTINQGCMFTIM